MLRYVHVVLCCFDTVSAPLSQIRSTRRTHYSFVSPDLSVVDRVESVNGGVAVFVAVQLFFAVYGPGYCVQH